MAHRNSDRSIVRSLRVTALALVATCLAASPLVAAPTETINIALPAGTATSLPANYPAPLNGFPIGTLGSYMPYIVNINGPTAYLGLGVAAHNMSFAEIHYELGGFDTHLYPFVITEPFVEGDVVSFNFTGNTTTTPVVDQFDILNLRIVDHDVDTAESLKIASVAPFVMGVGSKSFRGQAIETLLAGDAAYVPNAPRTYFEMRQVGTDTQYRLSEGAPFTSLTVPEPTSIAALAAAALGLSRRSKRA